MYAWAAPLPASCAPCPKSKTRLNKSHRRPKQTHMNVSTLNPRKPMFPFIGSLLHNSNSPHFSMHAPNSQPPNGSWQNSSVRQSHVHGSTVRHDKPNKAVRSAIWQDGKTGQPEGPSSRRAGPAGGPAGHGPVQSNLHGKTNRHRMAVWQLAVRYFPPSCRAWQNNPSSHGSMAKQYVPP